MENNIGFTAKIPEFTGQNYAAWSVRMKTYLKAFGLWDAAETGRYPYPLPRNPTFTQTGYHSECVAKKYKALTCIHTAVSEDVVIRIMTSKIAKQAWDKLQEEFQGNEKAKKMQVLNLNRELDLLRIKENVSVEDFADRVMKVVSQIRLQGEDFSDRRVVERVLFSLLQCFECGIHSLVDNEDLTTISLIELVHALQVVEQRRKFAPGSSSSKPKGKRESFPPCSCCNRRNHSEDMCWTGPDVQCRLCKRFGHEERLCLAQRPGWHFH